MTKRVTALEVARPPRRNWSIGGEERLYALALIDTRFGDTLQYSLSPRELGVAARSDLSDVLASDILGSKLSEPSEFVFRMNPKDMQLDEPAAVVIVPTQGGGQFIEHQGQIYKNLTISGTTGFRPNRRVSNILDPDTRLPSGEFTGFDDLISLRNLFRHYWSLKVNGEFSAYTLMVWQNGKEGDFYIVEPMNFQTTRSSSSPYTFDYTISLRTIERLDLRKNVTVDYYLGTSGQDSFLARVKEVMQILRQTFTNTESNFSAVTGTGRRALTDFLEPVNGLITALAGAVNASTKVISIPRSNVVTLVQNSLNLYESLLRIPTESNPFTTSSILTNKAFAAHEVKRAIWAASGAAAEDELYSEKLTTHVARNSEAYTDSVTGQPRTGGDPTNLNNSPIPQSTKQSTIQSGETIRSVSKRLLGTTNLWKQLVIVNDLRAPYISPDGDGHSVLRPNDTILYPVSGATVPESPVSSDKTGASVHKDAFTERLGRDIRLVNYGTENSPGNFDLETNARGDIALIEGVDNLKQSVSIKFSTEPGSLPVHPFFGILAPIGEKAKVRSLIQFQTNARASLLSDTRIEDVLSFSARADGNVVSVTTRLKIRGADGAISIATGVRR